MSGRWILAAHVAAASVAVAGCGDDSRTSAGAGGASSSTGDLPDQFTVRGVVRDQDGSSVADAIVLQGGRSTDPTTTTDGDGRFVLDVQTGDGISTVVATKSGFRTWGVELYEVPDAEVLVTLHAISPPDNAAYTYLDPGEGEDPSTAFCGHCHVQMTRDFRASGHAHAAEHDILHDLYAGVTRGPQSAAVCAAVGGTWRAGRVPGTEATLVEKCYLGAGVLPDLNVGCGSATQGACDDPSLPVANRPTAFGGCADCHAPAIDGVAGGRDLLDATGLAFETGVSCDPCHKISEIDMTQPAGIGRRLVLQRPNEINPNDTVRNVFYGPLLDVPNGLMGGSIQTQYAESVYCAGCHEHAQDALLPGEALDGSRWPEGLPIHSTYSEWQVSPAAERGEHCQHCHMPPTEGFYNTVDVTDPEDAGIGSGFFRPPEQIRSHRFEGALDGEPRHIDDALNVALELVESDGMLDVTATVTNVSDGHAVPTGEPMRALLLVVEATCDGQRLSAIGGLTIDDSGGEHARGIVGLDVAATDTVLSWAAGAQVASPGQQLRVVRPTGTFHDYPGVGRFADERVAATEKGLPIFEPVDSANVVATGGDTVTLDRAPTLGPGDIVILGDAWPTNAEDGDPARMLAGASGVLFARVLVDADGTHHVPHHRALDIVRDNRLMPGKPNISQHHFALGGCATPQAKATLLYRRVPIRVARERSWDPRDHVVAVTGASLSP